MYRFILVFLLFPTLFASCSSVENTAVTRWYHSFNTRYNVYFNAETIYKETLKKFQENYKENYSEIIQMFPVVSLSNDTITTGEDFNKVIEKTVKAIKTHSIQTKPTRHENKKNDLKYRDWINRTEYNPFLYNVWLLMAKSQFFNGDFLQAASTFSYISHLYNTQPEIAIAAKIWKARCFAEASWFYDADDIFSQIKRDELSPKLENLYSTFYADYLIKQKEYTMAVPYLETAIKAEKDKLQRNREKYLLGQIYNHLGQKDKAYEIFGEIANADVPYILKFSARVRQTEVYVGKDTSAITKQLYKMIEKNRNKDYLDQLYYALGNIYMAVSDTLLAMSAYENGIKNSIQQGIDKALNQVRLGDIYFTQKNFIKAQLNYADVLHQLTKEDEAYPRVSKRSAILDELVIYSESVNLQDSLQRLSKMSEKEKMEIINRVIEELRQKGKKGIIQEQENVQSEANHEQFNYEQFSFNQSVQGGVPVENERTFYFYNPQMVTVGKNTFQQKWGLRKLEDNWQRRDKTNLATDILIEENEQANEKTNVNKNDMFVDNVSDTLSSNIYNPQFYLQQIPVTEEDITASNRIIADALYNMAIIYKDDLENTDLALETFDILNMRFPCNEKKLESYYHTYLIYLKANDTVLVNLYKQKIKDEFPESECAIAIADPNYEYNVKMMKVMQDSLYRDTYDAYLVGDTVKIHNNYQLMVVEYSQSELMPKFMFLNALSYAISDESSVFKEHLRELIGKYPEADVSVLATEMMKRIRKGSTLSVSDDNTLAKGDLFNVRWGEDTSKVSGEIISLTFSTRTENPYKLLIVYSPKAVNDNLLLYAVANFNFSNFVIKDFDLEKTTIGEIGLLQIKEFKSFAEILQYIQMIYAPEGYVQEFGQSVMIVPISLENYTILMQGKTLEEYMNFFEEHFGKSNQNIIEYWKLRQIQETEFIDEQSQEKIEDISDTIQTIENPVHFYNEEQNGEVMQFSNQYDNEDSLFTTEQDIPTIYELEQQRIERKMEELREHVQNFNFIRSIQNLFRRKKSSNVIDEYARQQEQEEKQRLKQLKKEKVQQEKTLWEIAMQREKERQMMLKKQADEKKEFLKAKKQQEKVKKEEKKRKRKEKEKVKKNGKLYDKGSI